MTVPTPSHLGLCVADLDASLRFYTEGLGFELADRYDLNTDLLEHLHNALEVDGPVSLTSQMIVNGAMKIELLHYHDRQPTGAASASRGQRGLTHLSFTVADIEAATAVAVAAGGTVVDGTDCNIAIDVVFLEDPDGTRVELMQG